MVRFDYRNSYDMVLKIYIIDNLKLYKISDDVKKIIMKTTQKGKVKETEKRNG